MSMYVLQSREIAQPQYRPTPRPTIMTITGNISEFRYCRVMEQLTIELGNTGSRFEYWSRRTVFIRRFLAWYNLDTGLVRIGTQVTITIDKRLEIQGFK